MKDFFKSAGMLIGCIALARFILPANFTPLVAMAVFMPFLTNNKHLTMFLPVAILFATDIFLGFLRYYNAFCVRFCAFNWSFNKVFT